MRELHFWDQPCLIFKYIIPKFMEKQENYLLLYNKLSDVSCLTYSYISRETFYYYYTNLGVNRHS